MESSKMTDPKIFVPELQDTDTSVVYADINDDGIDDVILVNQSGLVGINQSQGSESFNAQLLDIDDEINSIHLADLDSDGDDDLVLFTTPNGGIGWAKNEGSDGFVAQQNLLFQGSSTIETTEIDDVNDEDDNDILFTQNGLTGYGILKNDGSENFVTNCRIRIHLLYTQI